MIRKHWVLRWHGVLNLKPGCADTSLDPRSYQHRQPASRSPGPASSQACWLEVSTSAARESESRARGDQRTVTPPQSTEQAAPENTAVERVRSGSAAAPPAFSSMNHPCGSALPATSSGPRPVAHELRREVRDNQDEFSSRLVALAAWFLFAVNRYASAGVLDIHPEEHRDASRHGLAARAPFQGHVRTFEIATRRAIHPCARVRPSSTAQQWSEPTKARSYRGTVTPSSAR